MENAITTINGQTLEQIAKRAYVSAFEIPKNEYATEKRWVRKTLKTLIEESGVDFTSKYLMNEYESPLCRAYETLILALRELNQYC
jgi:hypothetical protein